MSQRTNHRANRREIRLHRANSHHIARAIARIALATLTPLLEKNVLKTMPLDLPVVFSMSRIIVLAFAVTVLRHLWLAGIAGWPDATLALAVVLALPLLGALERVKAPDVVELVRLLVPRPGGDAADVIGRHSPPPPDIG